MCMRNAALFLLLSTLLSASAQDFPLIYPDGKGLPPGQGFAQDGASLYAKHCAGCHGQSAQGGTAPELVGGEGPLSAPYADKTIKTYWPFATTLFDTIRRGMPPEKPALLKDDEVYALVAFILKENQLWQADTALDAQGLAHVRMPNRAGFKTLGP